MDKKINSMEDWLGKDWKPKNGVKNIGDCKEPIETTEMPEWYCKFNQEPIKSE